MSEDSCKCRPTKPAKVAKDAAEQKDVAEQNASHRAAGSRREFLTGVAGLAGGAAVASFTDPALAGNNKKDKHDDDDDDDHHHGKRDKRRILIKDGIVVTMDPAIGNFAKADILIEGSKIVAVRPNIRASDAKEIDAKGMIVFPGFSDGHRHIWETQHRAWIPGGSIADYIRVRNGFGPHYRPKDSYIATLVAALGAIECGITTLVDIAHNSRSAAHSDAAIEALFKSNIRAVHAAVAAQTGTWDMQLPQDLLRLRNKYFSSDDQLVTLTCGQQGLRPADIEFARANGFKLNIDGMSGAATSAAVLAYGLAGNLGPDISLIHCNRFGDDTWAVIRDSGTNVVIAGRSDAELGAGGRDGIPGLQKALDFGIKPSLSIDNEYSYSGDMFTEMRALISIQRTHAFSRREAGDTNWPTPLTVRGMLELATVNGAKSAYLDHKVGTLSPGKEADIVLVKEDIKTMPTNNAVGIVVAYADSKNVDTVIIGGKVVKRDGELVGVDMRSIRKMLAESRDYLTRQAGETLDIFWDGFLRQG